jgi:hypothetical protein
VVPRARKGIGEDQEGVQPPTWDVLLMNRKGRKVGTHIDGWGNISGSCIISPV